VLTKKIQDGNFRQDLYFRLNVLNIRLPALRERGSDILLLAEHFLVRSTSPPKSLSAAAAKLLLEHSWPGNVRELENVIRSSSLAVRGAVIDARDLQVEPETELGEGCVSTVSALSPCSLKSNFCPIS
jgi:DNA-binding NtrC family response regulator